MLKILHGEETEPGGTIFNVFSNVIDTYHEPLYRPIEFEWDMENRTGYFSVPGVVDTGAEPIRNPVTGDIHRAQVTLPHGFEYHTAEYASGTTESGSDTKVSLEWQNSHGHFAQLHWTHDGVVHA